MTTFAAIISFSVDRVSLDDAECTPKTLPDFTNPRVAILIATGEGGSGLVTASYREPVAPGDGVWWPAATSAPTTRT